MVVSRGILVLRQCTRLSSRFALLNGTGYAIPSSINGLGWYTRVEEYGSDGTYEGAFSTSTSTDGTLSGGGVREKPLRSVPH